MYKGKGATFSVELGDGTYIVTAQGKTKVGKTEFTVGNAATSVTVALDQEKFEQATAVAGSGTAGYDATTGTYKFGNGAEWLAYFAAPTVNAETPFLLTATVDWFNADYQYAGFAVQTDKNKYVKFGVYYWPGDGYYGWAKGFEDKSDRWTGVLSNIEDNKPIELALAYNNGNYYLFVNNTHVLTVAVYESYPAPSGKVGLCASHEKTFADWVYSSDFDELHARIGATLMVPTDFTVKVGDTAVTNGKVLLGDVVTVSMSITEGQNIGLLLDGNAVSAVSADGMLTYTFTVTKAAHTVTYSMTYNVTVKTEAGANVSIFAGDSVTPSKTGTADASGYYIVALPNGTYKATASSETKLSVPVSVTVNGAAAEVDVPLNREKLIAAVNVPENIEGGLPTFIEHNASYSYAAGYDYGSYFSTPLNTGATSFVLTATVNMYTVDGRMAGFIVQTGENEFVRFGLLRAFGWYLCRYWDTAGNESSLDGNWYYQTLSGDTIDIALVYREAETGEQKKGQYYFFVNGVYAYSVMGYPVAYGKVGLAATHDVTFTDWGIAYNADDYFAELTLNIAGVSDDTAVSVLVEYNPYQVMTVPSVVTVSSGTVTVTVPKGTYSITVSADSQTGQLTDFVADGNKTVDVTLS